VQQRRGSLANPYRASSVEVDLGLADVAIDVAPAAIVAADEAAEFVQAVSAPADFISCDEFDFGVGFVLRSKPSDLEA
jgi:hypothetical protein